MQQFAENEATAALDALDEALDAAEKVAGNMVDSTTHETWFTGVKETLEDALEYLNEAFIIRKPTAARAERRAQEKEIPLTSIPKGQREQHRQALAKQWDEFVKWQAVEVLSLVESARIAKTVRPDTIMNPRVLYRDKNATLRTPECPLEIRPKARIIIPGHRDPELAWGCRTDAPTASRLSTYVFFQLCASYNFTPMSADIEAAFLQGDELERHSGDLYL